MPPDTTDMTLQSMQQSVSAMRDDMRRMATSIEIVGRLDERMTWVVQTVNTQIAELRALDTRVRTLESAAPISARTVTLVERAIWMAACAAVFFVSKKTGLS